MAKHEMLTPVFGHGSVVSAIKNKSWYFMGIIHKLDHKYVSIWNGHILSPFYTEVNAFRVCFMGDRVHAECIKRNTLMISWVHNIHRIFQWHSKHKDYSFISCFMQPHDKGHFTTECAQVPHNQPSIVALLLENQYLATVNYLISKTLWWEWGNNIIW